MFERDLALQQLKAEHANLTVIKQALNDNRPLEALYYVNNALDGLDETIGIFEEGDVDQEAIASG